jgi:hypothetical protein
MHDNPMAAPNSQSQVELVIGIGGHLGALPVAFSRPLALAASAVTLIFETRI